MSVQDVVDTSSPATVAVAFGEAAASGMSTSVAAALEAALRARAPGLHASTPMVRKLAVAVCSSLGFDAQQQALVDVGARVRDVGAIALPDSLVLATGSLEPADWELLNRHPVLGAELLEPLEGMDLVAEIVRAHHERWDGEGYPDGRRGEAIPVLSRVIAACDAFVAMTSDRPHRKALGLEAAVERVVQERGHQFDPEVVDALHATVVGGSGSAGRVVVRPTRPADGAVEGSGRAGSRGRGGAGSLKVAFERCEVLPAFGPAVERVRLAVAREADPAAKGDLVAAIESDTGLTVAILRAAKAVSGRRLITNVSDAVMALEPGQIQQAVFALPQAEFPWRTALEEFMHRLRVHAQTVSRAAQSIGRLIDVPHGDDLVLAALLHDVGKLVLAHSHAELSSLNDVRVTTPEQRVEAEQHAAGLDHASLGGVLVRRWGLPPALSSAVSAHHTSEREGELATFVRLADMVAHHAHGDPVDRRLMVRLAQVCGLPPTALKDVLFDLPHNSGSRRRRAEPSPLTSRETTALRKLAQGLVYKEIAAELGLSPSTVRSHLHSAYTKMQVVDRTQAVLRASEMAWI